MSFTSLKRWLLFAMLCLSISLSQATTCPTLVNQCESGLLSFGLSTLTCAMPGGIAANRLLVVYADMGPAITATIADSSLLTWTQTVTSNISSYGQFYSWTALTGAASGADTITLTYNNTCTFCDLIILEYSGTDLTSPADALATNSGSTSGAGPITSGNFVTTQNSELAVAYCAAAGFAGSALTPGTGYTTEFTGFSTGPFVEDAILSPAGTYASTCNVPGATAHYFVMAQTFKSHPGTCSLGGVVTHRAQWE